VINLSFVFSKIEWQAEILHILFFMLLTSGPTNFIYVMCIYKCWTMYMRSDPSRVSVLLFVIVNMLLVFIIII